MPNTHAMEILLRSFTNSSLLEDLLEVPYRQNGIMQMLSGIRTTTEMELYVAKPPFSLKDNQLSEILDRRQPRALYQS